MINSLYSKCGKLGLQWLFLLLSHPLVSEVMVCENVRVRRVGCIICPKSLFTLEIGLYNVFSLVAGNYTFPMKPQSYKVL